MGSLAETWSRLSATRKGVLVAAVIGTMVTLFFLVRTATAPEMKLLFSGMEDDAAGEIVTALDQMGVPNEVRGSAIYVPADQRDRLRIELASDGLVKDGSAGYELLDGMSGFGTTRDMYRTAVKRAVEGELQRTIEAMPDVRRARIMIAMGEQRPFQRDEARTTASVTVSSAGGRLSQSTARGIRYLVALAIPGLSPDQVAVIDMENGVILAPGDEQAGQASEDREERMAAMLRRRLEALLVSNVGDGNFTVQVTVETTREARTVSERIIDPDSQSPTSAQTTSTSERSTTPSATVTVASQLPDGDAAAGGAGAQGESESSTTSEAVAYTYSTTQREETVEPGGIRRIGVAIVVDEREEVGPEGEVTRTPRTREELQVIEQLIKAAIAFDEARGDTVEVVSLAFVDGPGSEEFGDEALGPSFMDQHGALLIQLGVLAIVAIALGLFVVRPILRSQPDYDEQAPLLEGVLAPPGRGGEAAGLGAETMTQIGGEGEEGGSAALGAEGGDGEIETPLEAAREEGGVASTLARPAGMQDLSDSQSELLRSAARDKLDASVDVLKRWLSARDDAAEKGV